MGYYEILPPYVWEVYTEKECIRTKGMLGKRLMCLYYAFHVTVINASITYSKYKSWITYACITYDIHVYSVMRKSLNIFSSEECNSMVASNKQRQEHNNLATIQRLASKTQGSPWALQEPLACLKTQMPTLTRMDKEVIEDYYQMTTLNENVNWMKQTHWLPNFHKTLGPPFVHLPLLKISQ